MDETVLKIALAGLMHDIGKFAERAGMDIPLDVLNSNQHLYQPYIKTENRHTHKHAAYTAAYIDYFDVFLPTTLTKAGWGIGDSFVNLAAGHHRPDTPMQWIIAIADRISSGFDRQEFEGYNAKIDIPDYKKTRLMTMFEHISINKKEQQGNGRGRWRYPLKALSPESIFPVLSDSEAGQTAEEEYKNLFLEFMEKIKRLAHREENIVLWYEHFDSLLRDFTSQIPAVTVGHARTDVSLYDHLRATAALAAALYRYHDTAGSLSVPDVSKDWSTKKFLLVSADFYGIQDFIFNEGGESAKGRAKTLRGRSFMVSLFSELAAHKLCQELGLPHTSVVLNAAGKFTLICHNTPDAKKALATTEEQINDWLVGKFYGENTFGVSMIDASPDDFVCGNFAHLWRSLGEKVDRRKYARFDLKKHGGSVPGYLNSFDNTLKHSLCPFCGKRPSVAGAMWKEEGSEDSCTTCRDNVFIGKNIVKKEKYQSEEGSGRVRLAVTTTDADLADCLMEPIFGCYRIGFTTGLMKDNARNGTLLRYWQIERGEGSKEKGVVITRKEIGGYVPVYSENDENDDRFIEGRKTDRRKEEMIDQILIGAPKTFHHLAASAKLPDESGDSKSKYRGIEALGVLKADVDNLGLIFAVGLDPKLMSLSRLATMSRQMNAFFAMYVPHCLETMPEFSNIYTVFVGGDDMFLIGPWNRVADFAIFMKRRFGEYVCGNPDITISAGIGLHKPGEPLRIIAESAEEALESSKNGGRNRLTMFGETVTWEELDRLEDIRKKIELWLLNDGISTGMLYRFGMFQEMEGKKKALAKSGITLAAVASAMWEPLFRYTIARNIKSAQKRDEVNAVAGWIREYGSKFKLSLWRVMYENRR